MNLFSFCFRPAFLALAFLTGSLSPASAAFFISAALTTGDGSPGDYLITSTTGNLLTSGYAGLGVFNLSDSQVASLAASRDYQTLFAFFQAIGGTDDFSTGSYFAFGVGIPGEYVTTAELTITPDLVGRSLYTLLSDSSDSSLATGFALFKASQQLAMDPPPPASAIEYIATPNNSTRLAGSNGPSVFSAPLAITVPTIQLVAVPEPSSFAVVITGLALASLRRRRRSSAWAWAWAW